MAIQRDFFYDPSFHGLDLKAAEKRYEVYLDRSAHRADLNYLFQEMLGNMSVGHHNSVAATRHRHAGARRTARR